MNGSGRVLCVNVFGESRGPAIGVPVEGARQV